MLPWTICVKRRTSGRLPADRCRSSVRCRDSGRGLRRAGLCERRGGCDMVPFPRDLSKMPCPGFFTPLTARCKRGTESHPRRMIPRRISEHLDPPVGKNVSKRRTAEPRRRGQPAVRIGRPGQLCAMMCVDGLGTVSRGSRNRSAGSKPAEVSVRCNVQGVGRYLGGARDITTTMSPASLQMLPHLRGNLGVHGRRKNGKEIRESSSFFCRRAGWETETDSGTDAFLGSLGATVAFGLDSDPRIAFRHRTTQ